MRTTTNAIRLFLGLLLQESAYGFTTTSPGISTAATLRPKAIQPFVASSSSSSLHAFRTTKEAPVVVDNDEPVFLESITNELAELCILTLRVGTCILMVHHGIDKLDHVEGFSTNVVAKFFGFLPGPPQFWTISAAATQVVGAGLLGVGLLARPVALSMMATMVTAVAFHLLNTGIEGFPLGVPAAHSYNFELAALYVAVLAYFSAAGAGTYSNDEKVLGRICHGRPR